MQLTFPSVLGIDVDEAENPIRQIAELERRRDGDLVPFTSGRTTGFLFRPGEPDEILILPNAKNVRDGYQRVLIGNPDQLSLVTIFPRQSGAGIRLIPTDGAEPDFARRIAEVLSSWSGLSVTENFTN